MPRRATLRIPGEDALVVFVHGSARTASGRATWPWPRTERARHGDLVVRSADRGEEADRANIFNTALLAERLVRARALARSGTLGWQPSSDQDRRPSRDVLSGYRLTHINASAPIYAKLPSHAMRLITRSLQRAVLSDFMKATRLESARRL
jgi:hypothetical protein